MAFWAWTVDRPGKWKLLIPARFIVMPGRKDPCWRGTWHILSRLGNGLGYQLFERLVCW
jgi:hypothetical protein